MAEKKIPRWLRKLNLAYQFIMIGLTVINMILSGLRDSGLGIPDKYFEYYCIIMSAFPIFWSKILDASKKYVEDLTPNSTIAYPPSSPSNSVHSLHSEQSANSV